MTSDLPGTSIQDDEPGAGRHARPDPVVLRVLDPTPELLARTGDSDPALPLDVAARQVLIVRRFATTAEYIDPATRELVAGEQQQAIHAAALAERLKILSDVTVSWSRVPPAARLLMSRNPSAAVELSEVRPDTVLGSGDLLVCEILALVRTVQPPQAPDDGESITLGPRK